jgi:hypothetical protein
MLRLSGIALAAALLALALPLPAEAQGLRADGFTAPALCAAESGGAVYFQPAGCGALRTGDVRLSGADFASRVTDSGGATRAVSMPPASVVFLDADGDGVHGSDESAYLKLQAGGRVAAGDLRLSPVGGEPAGTNVADDDKDVDLAVRTLPNAAASNWKFLDVDNNNAFSAPDLLYIDVNGNNQADAPDLGLAPARPDAGLTQQLQALLNQNAQLSQRLDESLRANQQLSQQLDALQTQIGNQTQQLGSLQQQLNALREENIRLGGTGQPRAQSPGFGEAALVAVVALGALAARRSR